MNPAPSSSLLRDTLRATAFMLVPVVAFLAILSAVALFAVPQPKEQPSATEVVSPVESSAPVHAPPNARAAVNRTKI